MDRSVDYNTIADEFDKRYARSDYGRVLDLLLVFAGNPGQNGILEVGCGTGH